jgi:hypothetical protein
LTHRFGSRHEIYWKSEGERIMKLKDQDILEFSEFFESALTRAANMDKQQKIRLRRKVRNELYSMLGFEFIAADAVMSRWNERLSDIFQLAPYGFEEELLRVLIYKLTPDFARKEKQGA